MTPGSVLSASIREHAQRRGIALIPFLTAGWPTKDSLPALLEQIAPHAAAIEVGIPFSDPMADGVNIQRTSREALEQGVTPRWTFDQLQRLRLSAPLVIMSYLNPLLSLGDELPDLCRAANIQALIIPDLPFDERDAIRGTGLIHMVTPLTPAPRLNQVAAASTGFLYAVTRTGVTGTALSDSELARRAHERCQGRSAASPWSPPLPPSARRAHEPSPPTDSSETLSYLARCRAASPVPICAGFGIRSRADIQALTGHADGAIIGSALVDLISRGSSPAQFLRGLMG